MATANASSANSCNLGGIMTRSNPIKILHAGSEWGVWSLHAAAQTDDLCFYKEVSFAWPSSPQPALSLSLSTLSSLFRQ
uniref:Uncharacterized protein n=1 Tax=Knipowitschia caucasica TaxID=637954 RepID=A0AAV2JPA6_KNICA